MRKRNVVSALGAMLLSLAWIYGAVVPNFGHASTPNPGDEPLKRRVDQAVSKIRTPFVENAGQFESHIAFSAQTFAGSASVTREGELVYLFRQLPLIKERMIDALPLTPIGKEPTPTTINYFIGPDKASWRTKVPTCQVVDFGEVYKGINLCLKAHGKTVEKVFTVQPGADPSAIHLAIGGGVSVTLTENGELAMAGGGDELRLTRPVAYQEIGGNQVYVKAYYRLCPQIHQDTNHQQAQDSKEHVYSFALESYDPQYALVIDPLLASTFFGGTGDDYAYGVAADSSGNIFITGQTSTASGFPATPGAYDSDYNLNTDAFVAKLSNDLSTLSAFTYLGGSFIDWGKDIAVDSSGNVYVTGDTQSSNFPCTTGRSYQAGYDIFVAKLDSALGLISATLLGGTSDDQANEVAIYGEGTSVYITGTTNSSNYPTTTGSLYETFRGGTRDAFISSLDSGLNLSASTFLGGTNTDYGDCLVIDSSGDAYVGGHTYSTDFPTTPGAFDTDHNSPSFYNAYISKLSGDLTSLLASTFFGTSSTCDAIAFGPNSLLYVAGYAATIPLFGTPYSTESYNGYVAAFVPDLASVTYSTYIGGASTPTIYGMAIDGPGNVFITGQTGNGYPTTAGAYDETYNGGTYDAFISKLDSALTTLLASTYMGGSLYTEGSYGIVLDASGAVFVAGYTESSDFPTTDGAYDVSFEGYVEGFVAKLDASLSYSGQGSISGTVYESDGATPITGGGWMEAYTGDPCGGYTYVSGGDIGTDGIYTIPQLPAGTYYLKAYPYGNYFEEWWGAPSTPDCNLAGAIEVNTGEAVTGKNFQLDKGATISGTVRNSLGQAITSTPITVHVYTGDDPCTEGHYQWQGSADVDPLNGTYLIQRLPAGTSYFLQATTEAAYLNEYWATPSSSPRCQNAGFFDLTAGQTVTGMDFQLDQEATISGTIYHADGTPVLDTEICVNVYTADTNACGTLEWVASGCTSPLSSALYQVRKLEAGTYYLQNDSGGGAYPEEWWADPNSSPDCQNATAITVAAGDTLTGKDFQVGATEPTITSFSPTSGGTGTIVVITGTNFTGTEVNFGGTPAFSFTVDSSTQITAVVGKGSTGKVTVTTDGGTATSQNDFTYTEVTPSVYWVDMQNGSDNNNGREETPWKTIHHAILQINGGSAGNYFLHILNGTYSKANGEADAPLVLTQSNVNIIGQMDNPPTIDGTRAEAWTKGLTITIEGLNCTVQDLIITGFAGFEEMGIEFNAGSNNNVQRCKLYGNYQGINFGSGTSDNVLRDCDIYQNNQGVVCYSDNMITQNTIHGNENDGVFIDNSSPTVLRNAIYDNSYGISVNGRGTGTASPTIRNNLIYEATTGAMNYYAIYVTAIDTATVAPTIYHNTLDGGTSDGIRLEKEGPSNTLAPEIKYNIVTNFGQYGINNVSSLGSPVIDYNDLFNNTTNYSNCDPGAHDLYPPLGMNPMFTDPTNGNFTLQQGSPCIDPIPESEGDPVDIDYLGVQRPKGAGYDMGAYEYVGLLNYEYTPPGGTGLGTDYRIFTVPLNLGTGATMRAQMVAALGAYAAGGTGRWRVFAYNGTDYFEMNSLAFGALNIKPGMGFWVVTLDTNKITFQGTPAPDGENYRTMLSPGWHMIGLPWINSNIYLGNIYVSDGMNESSITSANNTLTQKLVWEYTGTGGYLQHTSSSDALQCGTGYWIKVTADHDVTLIIPRENPVGQADINAALNDMATPSGDTELPPPPPGAEPMPGITANNMDGSVKAVSGVPVSVSVTLDPGAWAGRDADWWVAAHTPFEAPYNWYSYIHPQGWFPGIHRCVKVPLFKFASPYQVLYMKLPPGRYTFYFAVDGNADGKTDATWFDSVDVTVE